MRKWNVVGFKNVNYKSKKTGQQVEGYNLYLTASGETPYIEGEECKDIFISRRSCAYDPVVGDEINIIYNERGYVDNVVSVL